MKIFPQTIMLLVFSIITFTSCKKESAENNLNQISKDKMVQNTQTIEMIQFHSEHRCATCLKIESLTLQTLQSYPEISFTLVNVDDVKNEEKAAAFEAFGTALFLYEPASNRKVDLTEFAFMNVGDEVKFEAELKKEIENFIK